MAVLGVSSIAPVLPAVAADLNITTRQAGWLIAAFSLPGVILVPVAGLLADRLGRKRVLVPSLLLFAAAGHACAYAGDFDQLVALRILQGIGAAALGSVNVALIGDLYRGNARTEAMGYNSGVAAGAATAYPLLGGALAVFGWRYPFALPLLAVPVALLTVYWLKNPEPRRGDSFIDYIRKVAAELRNGAVAILFIAGLTAFTMLYGAKLTFLPFLLQSRFEASAADIGLVLGISSLGSMSAVVFLGAMARRFGARTILTWAFATMAVTLAAIPLSPVIWLVMLWSALFGMGFSIGISMASVQLTEAAPAEQRGAMMSLNGMMFRLGQTAGPILTGGLFAAGGMDLVFFGTAALALATAVLLAGAPRL